MNGIDKDLSEDYDDDGELDVEYYSAPIGLIDALKEIGEEGGSISKSLSPEIATVSSQAGNRAPGPGLGVNYVIFPPSKSKGTGYAPSVREMVLDDEEEANERAVGALHTKKEDYEFKMRYTQVHPYVYPDQYAEAHKDARKGSEERMASAKRISTDNVLIPKNKSEISQ